MAFTIAECLVYLPTKQQRHELEAFRIEYELENGNTDLTKHYTSMWPTRQQQMLYKHDPQRWFDGLPDFAREFLKRKVWEKMDSGDIELTNRTITRTSIRTGPSDTDIDQHWLNQYLGGPVRAPSDIPLKTR